MQRPSLHPQEEERLNIIKSLNILDTKPEERFDKITKMATSKLHAPISTITIIDKDREWFKSFKGITTNQAPRNVSFCGHTLLSHDVLIVEDTFKDKRFIGNPQVKANHPIRFYAGINLYHKPSGLPVGVFCIKDYKPRTLTKEELDLFKELAKESEYEINKEKTLHSHHDK
jgi:GAF domain-containing protein